MTLKACVCVSLLDSMFILYTNDRPNDRTIRTVARHQICSKRSSLRL